MVTAISRSPILTPLLYTRTLWLSLTEYFLNGWQFHKVFKGFREKSRTKPKRKNKIGKKKVDVKNHCSEQISLPLAPAVN